MKAPRNFLFATASISCGVFDIFCLLTTNFFKHRATKKHPAQIVERTRKTVGDGPPGAMKNRSRFVVVVILEHNHGDEALRNRIEALQATFNVMDENHGIFKAASAVGSDLGAKELAAQQRGQPADFNGSVKITAQQRASAVAILADFFSGDGRGASGSAHALPPCRERGGLRATCASRSEHWRQ